MNVCIIGTGYVGLVSAACFAEMGNRVSCVDVNHMIVESLKAGRVHIFEPGLEDLVKRNYAEGRLIFTASLEEGLNGAGLAFICVGTPPRPDGSCDLSHVEAVAREIGQKMARDLIVVDKSTVPVGTGDRVEAIVREELERRGVPCKCSVVSNPEFLKEGDAVSDFMKPDRVIVGTEDAAAVDVMKALYAPFARSRDKFIAMSRRSAEMTKYAANCMLAAKISFINEMANICERVGADVRDVRTGIGADHRIGYHFIYPGVGYGGSCFPKDVKALIRTARDNGFTPELMEAVDAVNNRQKRLMAAKALERFAGLGGAKGKALALWGLAFKANTDDMRESAALGIIEDLTSRGVLVKAYDPVAGQKAGALFGKNPLLEIVGDQYEACAGADALMVITEWNQFRTPDFERLKELLRHPLIFDGRNLYSASWLQARGFEYFCVGRAAR